MFKRKGEGGQRLFEQCSKKLHFSYMEASLTDKGCQLSDSGLKQHINDIINSHFLIIETGIMIVYRNFVCSW